MTEPTETGTTLHVVGHVIRLHPDDDCPDDIRQWTGIEGTPWCYDIAAADDDIGTISSCTGWVDETTAREAAMDDLRRILMIAGADPTRPRPILGETHLVATEEGHLFEPWTDGWAIGFKVTHGTTGQVAYVYLNPSSSDDPTGDANAFLYVGPDGDPAADDSVIYVDPFKD